MTEKNILITGGAGYVGSIITRKLLDLGYNVRMLEKFSFGLDSIKDIINHPNLEIIIGNLLEKEDVDKSLEGEIDSIIHLAAIVGDPACAVRADLAVETNFVGTMRLARQAKEKGISNFIFASTCSVYGSSENEILNETSELNPVSLYAETKIDAENGLMGLANEDFNPLILRFGTLYGLSPRMRFDLAVNGLSRKLVMENKCLIFGGDQWRPFIHVNDLGTIFESIISTIDSKDFNRIYNVGATKENYQMNDVGRLFEEFFPDKTIEYITEVKDKRSYHVDFSKLEKEIGFTNKKTVRDGISEVKKALEDGTIKKPLDPKYYNQPRRES
jgi:nucleoside-diphosphate-sugar epimerase